ncbi:MAG: hypothetical protein Tsb009_18360 [Planctomycetaceae bacterium]
MNFDEHLVNRIVQDVVAQLRQATPAVRIVDESIDSKSEQVLDEAVITADILAAKVNGQRKSLIIASRSILTPSAKDYLREHKINWTRCTNGSLSESKNARWLVVSVNLSPAVQSAIREFEERRAVDFRYEMTGCKREAVSLAIAEICRATVDGAIIVSENADEVACLANRQPKVRAVTAQNTTQIQQAHERLGANIFCVDSSGKSYMECRNLLRAVIAGGAPVVPANWRELP